jgi:HSP20 family molecular chaperone IbpA
MKTVKTFVDLGDVFDEIFDAAQEINNELHRNFNAANMGHFHFGNQSFDGNTDFYPNYSYPPLNVLMTEDRSLVFEFALAGFNEKDISLSFFGDYMIFSATIETSSEEENVRYFKHRLKMKNIEKQKYYVPLDKYAQEKVKAVFKNGILRVTIPPKEEVEQSEGVKIEIFKEGN